MKMAAHTLGLGPPNCANLKQFKEDSVTRVRIKQTRNLTSSGGSTQSPCNAIHLCVAAESGKNLDEAVASATPGGRHLSQSRREIHWRVAASCGKGSSQQLVQAFTALRVQQHLRMLDKPPDRVRSWLGQHDLLAALNCRNETTSG